VELKAFVKVKEAQTDLTRLKEEQAKKEAKWILAQK